MSKPHKWAKEIHAFADGATIQRRRPAGSNPITVWQDTNTPSFSSGFEFRIKPVELVLFYGVLNGRGVVVGGAATESIAITQLAKKKRADAFPPYRLVRFKEVIE